MFKRSKLLKREVLGAQHIPYLRYADGETVVLAGGELLSIIEIEGLPFECSDMDDVNAHDRALNALWLNVADENVMFWSMTIRRRVAEYPEGHFQSTFAQALDDRYRQKLNRTELFRNRLFLAILRAPFGSAGGRLGAKVKAKVGPIALDDDFLAKHKDKVLAVKAGLASVGARTLGIYQRDGLWWSEISTVLHWMLGGRMAQVPLTVGPVWSAIHQDRIIFGGDTLEVRYPHETRYGAVFGLKEYPSVCRPTMMNELLTVPFEVTVVQSWRFTGKAAAREILTKRSRQILSTQDGARKQIPLLEHALDELQDNKFTFGEHQSSVTVWAETPAALNDHMAVARSCLMQGGAIVSREDMGLEGAFWAQLPGNAGYRARSGYITTRNFSCLSPFHGYPKGKAEGNHWGPAVTLMRTSAGAPFYFSWHVRDLGNTFICGPSGAGKTALMNFLLAQSLKFKPRIAIMDKDRGCELFIRAVGGAYFLLRNGVATGCAPFKAIDITPETNGWFCDWIETLAGGTLSPPERAAIPRALNSLTMMPMPQRLIGGLMVYLDNTDGSGVAARLARWKEGGPLGWVFDGRIDRIKTDNQVFGFDLTEVLDIAEIRGPLMGYLFHRMKALLNGRDRVIFAIDEFWRALEDRGCVAFIQDMQKTIRKKNGMMIYATQSPRDALRSDISHTIIEQCATQIFLPNGRADIGDYREGMKLAAREFDLVAEVLSAGSRRFLIKQDGRGVVVELNLSGFDEELNILSGRESSVQVLDDIRESLGDDPKIWMPFLQNKLRVAA